MDLFVVIKLCDQLVEVKAWLRLGNAVLKVLDTVRNHSVINVLDRLCNVGEHRQAFLRHFRKTAEHNDSLRTTTGMSWTANRRRLAVMTLRKLAANPLMSALARTADSALS